MSTKISWCDETINPVVGCSKISEGCQNCYAENMARRLAAMRHVQYMHVSKNGQWNGKTCFVPSELDKPYKWRKPRTVFISSMGDLFHDSVPFGWIESVLGTVASNPQHTFIMLTKRAQRMREFFQTTSMAGQLACLYQLSAGTNPETCQEDNWPLPNLALGVSVENQAVVDERIPKLIQTPSAKRFVSLEPMLGPVDLRRVYWPYGYGMYKVLNALTGQEHTGCGLNCNKYTNRPHLDGVILGGESGNKTRPLHLEWVRMIREQCSAAGVPFMFKQWGKNVVSEHGRPWEYNESGTGLPELDGKTYLELAWAVNR